MLVPSIMRSNVFDDFMDDFCAPVFMTGESKTKLSPMRTDVRETENGYELDIDLPGYSKDNVKATIKDGYLTISATIDENGDTESEDGKYIRRERYTGSMKRSFYVGEQVDEDAISAKFTDGILKLTIPKTKPVEPQEKLIAIEG